MPKIVLSVKNKKSIMRKLLVGLALLWVFIAHATEQENAKVSKSLAESYKSARAHDKQYLSEKFNKMAELGELARAKSFLLPSLSAELSASRINQKLVAPDLPFVTQGSVIFPSNSYSVTLSQILFDKSKWGEYQKSKLSTKKTYVELIGLEQELALRTATSYLLVVQAQHKSILSRANLLRAREQHELLQIRLMAGLSTDAELSQAYSRWQLAIAREIDAQNEQSEQQRLLSHITGSDSPPMSRDLDFEIVGPEIINFEHDVWLQDVEQNNPDISSQELALAMFEQEIKVKKAAFFPTVELTFNHINVDDDGSLSGPASNLQSSFAMATLKIPLYSGGRNKSGVKSALHERDGAVAELENIKNNIKSETITTLNRLANQSRTIAALSNATSASKVSLSEKNELYQAGLETNLSVLDAQRDLYTNELELSESRHTKILLLLKLHKLAGTLDLAVLESLKI